MTERPEFDLAESKRMLAILEEQLEERVDPATISIGSKTPYKAVVVRECLLYRVVEIGRSVVSLIESHQYLASLILVRASMETAAAQAYLNYVISEAGRGIELSLVDEKIMQLLLASRDPTRPIQAINILTMLDRLDRRLPGIRAHYDQLSEHAHPNWQGTAGLFSEPDPKNLWTDLGFYVRSREDIHREVISSFGAALAIFSMDYIWVVDDLARFIDVCEDYQRS